MDPFRMLQSRAAEKRNQAIADARRQYRKDIEVIESLERQLPAPLSTIDRSKPFGKVPSIVELIQALVPAGKPRDAHDGPGHLLRRAA